MNTVNCPNCGQSFSANQNFCSSCGQTLTSAFAASHQQTPDGQAAAFQAPPSPPSLAAMVAPPSLLVLFYAHQLIPAGGLVGGSTAIPCQNFKARTPDLVNQMMAAAFWHLRERGFISIETGKKHGWIFKSTPVNVRLLQTAQLVGFEHDFLEAMRVRQTETTVEQIIVDYLREDTPDPTAQVLERAAQWAVHLGYGQSERKQGFFKPHEVNIAPDCNRISRLSDAAQAFQTAWRQFQTQEAPLFAEIIKDCKDALRQRTERPERDDDSDSSFD